MTTEPIHPAVAPFQGTHHTEQILDVFPVFVVIEEFLHRMHPGLHSQVTGAFLHAWRHELEPIQRGTLRRYFQIRFRADDPTGDTGPLPAAIRDDPKAALVVRVVEGMGDEHASYLPCTREFAVNVDFALLDAENELPILFTLGLHGCLEHYAEIRGHIGAAKEAAGGTRY